MSVERGLRHLAIQSRSCGACREGAFSMPFTMAFQPIVDVLNHRITAYEALVRGPNGESAQSILADLTPATVYAFDQACRTTAIETASRLGLQQRLNINFLPNAVYEPQACIRTTLDAAARTGFPLTSLTFEIVETEEAAEPGHLRRIVEAYREIGFRIALDDYGTGHSGPARLADLNPDTLKVDRVLVAGCDHDRTRRVILGNILALGQELGIDIVFEGVETEDEARSLTAMGGRYMQGYYFARPALERLVPEDEIHWPPRHEPHNGAEA